MRLPDSFLPALQRGSDEPLFAVSLAGRVVWWGHVAQSLFGYARRDAVGRPIATLVLPPSATEAFANALARAAEHGAATAHIRLRTRDGRDLGSSVDLKLERRRDGLAEDVLVSIGPVGAATSPTSAATAPEPAASVTMRGPTDRVEIIPVRASGASLATHGEPRTPSLQNDARDALTASHDASVMLVRLARVLVPAFADVCAAWLFDAGGAPQRVAALAVEGSTLAAPDAAPPKPDAAAPVDPRTLVLPLQGRIRAGGTFFLARSSIAPAFSDAERSWAEDLARRIALEVENVRLIDLSQRARDDARRAVRRAEQLQALAGALSGALTANQIAETLLVELKRWYGAAGCALCVITSDRASVEVVATAGDAEPLCAAKRAFPISTRSPLADAARSGHPTVDDATQPALTLVGLPLTIEGRTTGALGITFRERRDVSHETRSDLQALARHVADGLERVRLYEAERRARAEAAEEARRLEIVAEASRLLASRLDDPDAMQMLARTLVPGVADWCVLFERDAEKDAGALRPVAWFHRDSARIHDLGQLARLENISTQSPLGLGRVFASGRPQLLFNVPDHLLAGLASSDEHLRLLRSVGITSQMMLPLVGRERTLGVLVVTYSGSRRYSPSDVVLLEELARRAALALDNARLFRLAQENEERYRLLVEGVHDHAIYYLDVDGRVVTWNVGAQRLYGYESSEIVGRSFGFAHAPEAGGASPDEALATAAREGRFEEEAWRVRKDGSRLFVSAVLTRLLDDAGRMRGFAVHVRDLTERRRAREALEQARGHLAATEKMSTLGSLVSGVAHEIRTPLTVMSNNLHIMELRIQAALADRRDDALLQTLHDRITSAITGIDRMNRLVEDLRKFTRVKPGTRARVPLETVVPDAIDLFSAAQRGRIAIETDLQRTPPCEVDVLQVQQILLNLLQNASDAMPRGGRIRVATRPSDDQQGACIVVEDEGSGMPPDVYARMFEEFFTTKPQGTGLGLSIVRRIVESHKGRIDCETWAGKGTRFTITLPRALS